MSGDADRLKLAENGHRTREWEDVYGRLIPAGTISACPSEFLATPATAPSRSRPIWLSDRRLEVRAVLDRWYSPTQRWFKVDADDGNVYVLRHDEASDEADVVQLAIAHRSKLAHTAHLYNAAAATLRMTCDITSVSYDWF